MVEELFVNNLCVGRKLADPVFTTSGLKVIQEGTLLTKRSVERLHNIGIKTVKIKCNQKSYSNIISPGLASKILNDLDNNICLLNENKDMDFKNIKELIDSLIYEIGKRKKAGHKYKRLEAPFTSLAIHSLNVSLLTLIILRELNYSYNKIKDILVGALYHDIGKVKNNDNHPQCGYEILKRYHEISTPSYITVLKHHDLDSPHEFIKIVALCNDFDNLMINNKNPFTILHEKAGEESKKHLNFLASYCQIV